MRISDWSSDVCSSDLVVGIIGPDPDGAGTRKHLAQRATYNSDWQVTLAEVGNVNSQSDGNWAAMTVAQSSITTYDANARPIKSEAKAGATTYAASQASYDALGRSEENTSELQSLMRISYAVFGLKKKK